MPLYNPSYVSTWLHLLRVEEIEADAAAERKRTGREPFGAAAILRQHPHAWPDKSKKSPAPRFHAASKAAREALRKALAFSLRSSGKLRRRSKVEPARRGSPTAAFHRACLSSVRERRHRRTR